MKLTDLRGILQYIPQFREKTFILAIDGAIVTDENFVTLLLDVALLWSLNIRVVLVHGAAAQIKALAEERGVKASDLDGTGVTDAVTLDLALAAANRLTHEILEGLSANDLRAATTNVIIAHPVGILQGVDQLFTGKVERVDAELLQSLLSQGVVPVIPPLGFDGDGKTYRVNSDGVAVAVAEQLKAIKLIYVTSQDGLMHRGQLIRQMLVADLAKLLQQDSAGFPAEMLSKAQHAVAACNAGVPRVHVINGTLDEGLLGEVFSNHGLGTLIYANEYEHIRPGQEEGRARHSNADAPGSRGRRTRQADQGDHREEPWRLLHLRDRQEPGGLCCAARVSRGEPGRAGAPVRQLLARESGHRAQAASVRREPGPRTGPAGAAGAVHAGVHVLSVQGRFRRRHT